MKTTTVTVKLPRELDAKVECLASQLNQNKSAVIRLALQELFRMDNVAERMSAYSVAEPYCGRVAELPPDLSYNTGHLKGYGAK